MSAQDSVNAYFTRDRPDSGTDAPVPPSYTADGRQIHFSPREIAQTEDCTPRGDSHPIKRPRLSDYSYAPGPMARPMDNANEDSSSEIVAPGRAPALVPTGERILPLRPQHPDANIAISSQTARANRVLRKLFKWIAEYSKNESDKESVVRDAIEQVAPGSVRSRDGITKLVELHDQMVHFLTEVSITAERIQANRKSPYLDREDLQCALEVITDWAPVDWAKVEDWIACWDGRLQ